MSYKDMAHHCETLLTGKQHKMSDLMGVHLRQDSYFQNPFHAEQVASKSMLVGIQGPFI